MVTIVEDRNLAYSLGATEYLTKPVDRERLVRILRQHPCAQTHPARCWSSKMTPTQRDSCEVCWSRKAGGCSEAENGAGALVQLG